MNTNVITALGMCKVCTEAIHSVARKRQDWTCESTCEHENAKTRKRENGRNQPVGAKTAKTRKRRKQENRENGENAKMAKTRKRENGENGQKCSCFLVFNFSFSGFLGFLGFLVFSFSGFLVPLAAPFWPGRVFYVLRCFGGLCWKTIRLPYRDSVTFFRGRFLLPLGVREKPHGPSARRTALQFDWRLLEPWFSEEIQKTYPIGSMYGIFTYIWLIFMVNATKYTIHGSYGYWNLSPKLRRKNCHLGGGFKYICFFLGVFF